MILDRISNLAFYTPLEHRIARAVEFLRLTDLSTVPDGRYEIEGEEVFAMISEQALRESDAAPLECHDRYLDIQIVIRGKESYGWSARSTCSSPRGSYNEEKDILFYEDHPVSYITLQENDLAIFFPEDAHAPLIGAGSVRKCIIKVRCCS